MPFNPPNFLSSKTIEVQSRTKSFFVHGDILAAQSKPLYSSIAGKTAGSKVDLSYWDSDTVERLLQFLYYGDYQVPEPIPEEEDELEVRPVEKTEISERTNTPDTVQSQEALEETLHGQPMANILLVHAELHTIAYYQDVKALRKMSLERLSSALEEIDGCMKGPLDDTADVIELLEYINHQRTPYTPPQTSSEETVWGLALDFAAKNFEDLMEHREMSTLLRKGGNFAVELMERVAKRLCDVRELSEVRREAQVWKSRAASAERKIQRPEATRVEAEHQLEVIAQREGVVEPDVASEEKVQQLEATGVQKVPQVVTKAKYSSWGKKPPLRKGSPYS